MTPKVFLDSDVIISSLISQKGAASLLLRQKGRYVISSLSVKEINVVIKRLSLSQTAFKKLCQTHLTVIPLAQKQTTTKYKTFTLDPNDAHVVAGAYLGHCRFLVTYNLRYFHTEAIKRNLNLIVLTPGQYLQYQRRKN